MQSMSHFMKQRGHIVETDQRWFAVGRTRNVQNVDDHRLFVQQSRLIHKRTHPGPAAFGVTFEKVSVEKPDLRTIAVEHIEHTHVRMIDRKVFAFAERNPVQLVHREEHTILQDAVEFKVGLHSRFIDFESGFADLLCVVFPVPWSKLMVDARFLDHLLQVSRFDFDSSQHAWDQICQHLASGSRSLCHLILKLVGRMVLEPQQFGSFSSQLSDLQNQRAVVDSPIAAQSSKRRCFPDAFSKRSIVERRQNGYAGCVGDLQKVLAFESSFLRSLGGRSNISGVHTVQFFDVIYDDRSFLADRQQVFFELRLQLRQLFIERSNASLLLIIQLCSSADEAFVMLLQHLGLLAVQFQRLACVPQFGDSFIQTSVQQNIVGMSRLQRSQLRFNIL